MQIKAFPIKKIFLSLAEFLDKRSFLIFVLLAILVIVGEAYFFNSKYQQINVVDITNAPSSAIFNQKTFDTAVGYIQNEQKLFSKTSIESIANPFMPKKPDLGPINNTTSTKK